MMYAVFCWAPGLTRGGWNDFVALHGHFHEAERIAEALWLSESADLKNGVPSCEWQIVDLRDGQVVHCSDTHRVSVIHGIIELLPPERPPEHIPALPETLL